MDGPEFKPVPLWDELRPPREKPGTPAWLFSFTDLTGLLVAFFVLMFSTQVIDRDGWQELTGSLRAAFNPRAAVVAVVPSGQANALRVVETPTDVLPYLDSLLQSRLGKDEVWRGVRGRQTEGELVYDVPEALWYAQKPQAAQGWGRLAGVVRGWKNPLRVRVVVAGGQDAVQAAGLASALAATMVKMGAVTVAGEVVSGNITGVQFVVRGE